LSPPHIGVGLFKIDQMPVKKDSKETARLTIRCNDDNTCTVTTKGNKDEITACLASLMSVNCEVNEFREMLAVAFQIIIIEHKMKEKKTAKKKAAEKKK